MMHDPLNTVLRLRQRAVDQARLSLLQSLSAESAADREACAAEHSIEAEATRATDIEAGDELVECFAIWLPEARQRARNARLVHERLGAEVARKRAELAASRTGLEAIETLLRQKREAMAAEELRRMQHAIDEAGARRNRT